MMHEFTPLERESAFRNVEKFYVLAYEGEVTEKVYFNSLRKSSYFNDSGKVEIYPLERKKNEGTAPTYVKARLNEAKRNYRFRSTDEFWLVIDRDHWEDNQHIDLHDIYDSCAKEKNFFIAFSNPCFEIWLILHLTGISRFSGEEQTAIMRNEKVSESKNYIDIVLAGLIDEARGDGKQRGYNKRPNAKIFMPRLHDAIANAKAIPSNKDGLYLDTIGTDVYKLVEKLIK